ncbi:MAG TPA: formylmethanofuran--tetrahydromethanopterin N-formyltransferase [Pirellulaceae bacterium]|nr:formylmethanofuran--tetrahydromethanopterin N-formyltransferase [Pirellulaceae bacterium]
MLHLGNVEVEETFAEAFGMVYCRIVVTAANDRWLSHAEREFAGYACSVIACDAEVGRERSLSAEESPDGRPAAAMLCFGMNADRLAKAVVNRTGQCLMTCPTTAVFGDLAVGAAAGKRIALGKSLRYFGDGFQKSKKLGNRRFWRIPVMDGEFLVEEATGVATGVAGGNLIFQGPDERTTLSAAERAVDSVRDLPGVIAPFPGGIARSGSKVGSRYTGLIASTADAFCPTLRGRVASRLHPDANCAYELVVNGIDESAVRGAMRLALMAAAEEPILRISAGNYGGKLGKHHIRLAELLGGDL